MMEEPGAICTAPCVWCGMHWSRGDVWLRGTYSAEAPTGPEWVALGAGLKGRLVCMAADGDVPLFGMENGRRFQLSVRGERLQFDELPRVGPQLRHGAGVATSSFSGCVRWAPPGTRRPAPPPAEVDSPLRHGFDTDWLRR